MDVELLFGILGLSVAAFTTGWGVITHFTNRRYSEQVALKVQEKQLISEEISDAVKAGKLMVNNCNEKVETYQKYSTQQFEAIKSSHLTFDKRLRVLESQLVAKETVREMLDDRVRPVEVSVEKLEHTVEKGFKNLEERQALWDMNICQILNKISEVNAGVAEIKGYNRARSECEK